MIARAKYGGAPSDVAVRELKGVGFALNCIVHQHEVCNL